MFWMFCSQIGLAGGFSDALQSARAEFHKGDDIAMARHLSQAKNLAQSSNTIVKSTDLALMMYLSGLAAERRGEEPLNFWRKTFSLYLKYEGEADLFASKKQADFFFAVRMEMEYAEQKSAFIPEKIGLAKIFIDGQEKFFENTVLSGEHLIQIQCPKGELVSRWSTLEEDPQWLSMCPYEIDIHASNEQDDPFSLNMLDSSEASLDIEEPVKEDIQKEETVDKDVSQEVSIEKEKELPAEVSYFSGVKVKKMKAKPVFWIGAEGGFFVDTKEDLQVHGDVVSTYQLDPFELELHAGVQLSGGINYTVVDGALIGAHAGYHILQDDLFIDARFRKEFSFTDGVRGYTRIRFGYMYSWKTVFSGADVGLLFSVF